MRLSELVANLTPSEFAQVALLLFLAVFLAVAWRALGKSARDKSEQWASLPLCEDTTTTQDPPASERTA